MPRPSAHFRAASPTRIARPSGSPARTGNCAARSSGAKEHGASEQTHQGATSCREGGLFCQLVLPGPSCPVTQAAIQASAGATKQLHITRMPRLYRSARHGAELQVGGRNFAHRAASERASGIWSSNTARVHPACGISACRLPGKSGLEAASIQSLRGTCFVKRRGEVRIENSGGLVAVERKDNPVSSSFSNQDSSRRSPPDSPSCWPATISLGRNSLFTSRGAAGGERLILHFGAKLRYPSPRASSSEIP